MQTRNSLAVVDDQYVYTVGGKWQHAPITRLESLLTLAKQSRISHIWILEKSQLSARLSGLDGQYEGWNVRAMPSNEHIGYCSGIQRGDSFDQRIQIGFGEFAPWPWYRADSPKTLLATLAYLEDALGGVPIEWTPAHVGLDFLQKKNTSRWHWFSRLTLDLEQQTPGGGFGYDATCTELHHRGDLLSGTHLVKLDINSDYGAIMTGLRVGEGNPAWSPDPAPYDGKRPGFWRVAAKKRTSLFDGGQLPAFDHMRWMTTDMIEQLRAVGYAIQIEAGWWWQRYHQSLRSTISTNNEQDPGLWDLRILWRGQRELSVAHDNVYESISAILHTIHGKLGDDDLGQRRFRRPDMWAMVVAGAIARKIYRMVKIHQQFGLKPCRIEADACWYAVDDPATLDSIIDANKLGGWKKVYTLRVSEELRAAWPSLSTGQLNRWSDKVAV